MAGARLYLAGELRDDYSQVCKPTIEMIRDSWSTEEGVHWRTTSMQEDTPSYVNRYKPLAHEFSTDALSS